MVGIHKHSKLAGGDRKYIPHGKTERKYNLHRKRNIKKNSRKKRSLYE